MQVSDIHILLLFHPGTPKHLLITPDGEHRNATFVIKYQEKSSCSLINICEVVTSVFVQPDGTYINA